MPPHTPQPPSPCCLRRTTCIFAAILGCLASLRAFAQAPTNDFFLDRQVIGAALETHFSTNALATAEASEPTHRGLAAANSLWWRWTAPLDGYVVMATTNSPGLTRVALYDGGKFIDKLNPLSPQRESALPDAYDRFEFHATRASDYNLAVDSLNGHTGPVQLDIKLYTRPEIINQPADLVVTVGDRPTLSSRALGKFPLTYQWQFTPVMEASVGFASIPGGTNRVLELGPSGVVRTNERGRYRAIIRNEYGSVTSSVVRVEVTECVVPAPPLPPAITNSVGRSVSFTASAVGTPPISYQWQFMPTNTWVFTNLPAATSSNLVLTNLSIDQAGAYRFLASNVACSNRATTNVSLLVINTNHALVLDTNLPADLFRITNENASFSLSVIEGYQPIWFQWYFTPISGPTVRLEGKTAPDLWLPGVRMNQNGTYWATASNHWGRAPNDYTVATTRGARLTVETRPPNDLFVNRIPVFPAWTNLSSTNLTTTYVHGWNKNGTSEPGEKPHQTSNAVHSVWWSLRAPVPGHVVAFLDPVPPGGGVLATYTGSTVDELAPVAVVTNTSTLFDFVATTNVEYCFAVEAAEGEYTQTNISLQVQFNPDLGAPGFIRDLDLDLDFFMMGMLFGDGDGCTTFNQLVVQATSLDGIVKYQWQFATSTNGAGNWVDLPGQTNANLIIPNLTTANTGYYRAKVTNGTLNPATGAYYVIYSHVAHLTVVLGPQITQGIQPGSITTNACTAAQFEVKAASCSPLHYQWRQNGLPVTQPNVIGVHSNLLVLTNLTPANEGIYDVVISNAYLSTNVGLATLTLTNYPVFRQHPLSRTNHGCETATFMVDAFADCQLTYRWLFYGTNYPAATNATLILPNVQPANAGPYSVVVSTPFANRTSQVAQLTVEVQPVILGQPTNQNVHVCSVVNLQVRMQAEQPAPCSWLSYQWQLYGTNLLHATNTDLSLQATASSAGPYRVVISNRWTSVTSAVAQVNVDAAPLIGLSPQTFQRVRTGDTFNLVVREDSCGTFGYIWQYRPPTGTDFTNVPLDARRVLQTNGYLSVLDARTNDSGFYRVLVTNRYAISTSLVAQVRVVRPPLNDDFANAFSLGRAASIATNGYNEYATAEPGEPAHGLQPPNHSVWWFWTNPYPSLVTVDLSGSDIDTTLGIYTGITVSSLVTYALDDNGGANGWSRVSFMAASNRVLRIAVDSKFPELEATNLQLSVSAAPIISPPIITEQPVHLAANPGDTIVFTNRCYGSPDIQIRWYQGGTLLSSVTQIEGLTNYLSTLTLTNVQPLSTNDLYNGGVYFAVLSNNFGSVTTKLATLTFGCIVRGMVTDATKTTTNRIAVGIPGARIWVGDVETQTDTNGNYVLVGVRLGELRADFQADKRRVHLGEPVAFANLSTAGAAQLRASKAGYYDYQDNRFEVGRGGTVEKRFSMSPIFQGLRFVLNWTNIPTDLDLVMTLPDSVPVNPKYIDYLARGNSTNPPYVTLDADIIDGWGPETISIHHTYPGTYRLYGRKFQGQATGGATLSQSDARVMAYWGSGFTPGLGPELRPFGALDVPAAGTENWWHICDIDGTTTNIAWVNQLLPASPLGGTNDSGNRPLGLRSGRAPKDGPPVNVDYEWLFGDGHSSNLVEPTHAYAEPGWKTVTLRVTERAGTPPRTALLTRTNYIYVENLPPIVAITNPASGTIFRAGDAYTLTSSADGVDDPIERVEYYLDQGTNVAFVAAVSNVPYALTFPNTNRFDHTNTFLALAHDMHGGSTWSAPHPIITRELGGEILIIRNFESEEIATMVNYLNYPMIPTTSIPGQRARPPIVRVLDQEGLRWDLVKGFKLIIWNDQGDLAQGLRDNDVELLYHAYRAGIPLYLMGQHLAAAQGELTDLDRWNEWRFLVGMEHAGTLAGPTTLHGMPLTDPLHPEDGIFLGLYGEAEVSTNLPYGDTLEGVRLLSTNLQVVVDAPVPGVGTNNPVMLLYKPFREPDFGETRRLVQNFRVTPEFGIGSAADRRVLFINGAAWLMRLYYCNDINPFINCLATDNPAGSIGQEITFAAKITQNGGCPVGGVLITNRVSPRLQVLRASIVPFSGAPPTATVSVSNNLVVGRIPELQLLKGYDMFVVAAARRGGWLTNEWSGNAGLYPVPGCAQVAFIEGVGCEGPFRLTPAFAPNHTPVIILTGGAGCDFELQGSADLRTWQSLGNLSPTSDSFQITLPPFAGGSQFYRVRRVD